MPSPITTCLLVAAVLIGLAAPLVGAAIAVGCALYEFLLPTLAA
jgi:hypothetical protein